MCRVLQIDQESNYAIQQYDLVRHDLYDDAEMVKSLGNKNVGGKFIITKLLKKHL